MIAVEMFTHETTSGGIVFEEGDLRIVNISKDDWLAPSDIDLLIEATMNLDTDVLKLGEWYQFTFKRVYDDDGSGARNDLWFDLMESIIVTRNEEKC